jgi:hypothetical protein
MRRKYTGETQRVQTSLSKEEMERLQWLTENTEARNWGEVVRNALVNEEKRVKKEMKKVKT